MDATVRETLRRIVAERGRDVYENHRRFENLLHDLCAGRRREISLLVRALPERVAADLLTLRGSVPREVLLRRLARRLEQNLAVTEEAALWTVESWDEALLGQAPDGPVGAWYEFTDESGAARKAVKLSAGLAVFETTYGGAGNFLVELYDGAGRYVELLANEVGPSHSVKPARVAAGGEYVVDVSAGGRWSLEVRQPSPLPDEAREPPFSWDGSGQRATPFFRLPEGPARFEVEHAGRGNFVVTLLTAEGRYAGLLANEVGSCKADFSVRMKRAGDYLLDVAADGSWKVSVTGTV